MTFASSSREGFAEWKEQQDRIAAGLEDDDRDDGPRREEWDYMVMDMEDEDIG